MKLKRLTVLLLALLLMSGACSSYNKSSRTLKPGKPIPCPQKDC